MSFSTWKKCVLSLLMAATIPATALFAASRNAEPPLSPADEVQTTETTGSVQIISPDVSKSWYGYYDLINGYYKGFIHFLQFPNLAEGNCVRVQLADTENKEDIRIICQTAENSETAYPSDGGGVTIPYSSCCAHIESLQGDKEGLFLKFITNHTCDVPYSVIVYSSDNINEATKLAEETFILHVTTPDQQPLLTEGTPAFLSGDVNTAISLPIEVHQAGYLAGQKVAIWINFAFTKGEFADLRFTDQMVKADEENKLFTWEISELSSGTTNLTLQASAECAGTYSYSLIDATTGKKVCNTGEGSFSIPFYDKDDLSLLQQIAKANIACNDLQTFISEEKYKLDWDNQGNIQVAWTEDGYVKQLKITDWGKYITTMPKLTFPKLQELEIQETGLTALDLTQIPEGAKVKIYNSLLTWKNFIMPKTLNFTMEGNTKFDAGTILAGGSVVDLSAYADWNGTPSEFLWWKEESGSYPSSTNEVQTVSNETAKFILPDNEGVKYSCQIYNRNYFSGFHMETNPITITSAAAFDKSDIDALKQLAKANSKVKQLQEYIDNQSWETDDFTGYRSVRTYWEEINGSKRLTKLCIEAYGSSGLTNLDLSAFPELRFLQLAMVSYNCTFKLSENKKLTELIIYSYYPEAINVSANIALQRLELASCSNLRTVTGLQQLTNLHRLSVEGSEYVKFAASDYPASLTDMDLRGTESEMPGSAIIPNLDYIGLPKGITSFDMSAYPKLTRMDLGWSQENAMRYEDMKNYRNGVRVYGNTLFKLTPNSSVQEPDEFAVGDIIDLSSQATVNGVASTFTWKNKFYGVEVPSGMFEPVDGKPGVFEIKQASEDPESQFYCQIQNNFYSGWTVSTNYIKVTAKQTYSSADLQVLKTIVDNSTSQDFKDWFAAEGWKENGSTKLEDGGDLFVQWSDESNKRLTELSLYRFGDRLTGTIDVSSLNQLQRLNLCSADISSVLLPTDGAMLQLLYVSYTKIKHLDVSRFTNLFSLGLDNTGLTSVDLKNNTKLQYLYLEGTTIELPDVTFSELTNFGTPSNLTSLDMEKMPKLSALYVRSPFLKFSDIMNPHELTYLWAKSETYMQQSDELSIDGRVNMIGNDTIDFSKEANSGELTVTLMEGSATATEQNSSIYTVNWDDSKLVRFEVTNSLFPGWSMYYQGSLFTTMGDVNYDEQVNVGDVATTAAYLVNKDALQVDFSTYAADINKNNGVDVADLVEIVNVIFSQTYTQTAETRSTYVPSVRLALDGQQFLTMENEAAVSALYLEFVGATEEKPLLADAARLSSVSRLQGDTLRVVAYNLNGNTIASGTHRLMQLAPGMRLVKAEFSDAQAHLLSPVGNVILTANTEITPPSTADVLYNYPNPSEGHTTFCYQLTEPVRSAEIQLFAVNGTMVARWQGLDATAGAHTFTAQLPLPAGIYYYRLVADGKQVIARNTLIIK